MNNFELPVEKENLDHYIEREDVILSVASYCALFALMLQTLLYGVLGSSTAIHTFVLAIAAVPTLLSFPLWIKYAINRAILIYGFFALVYCVQYMVFPENHPYMTEYLFQFLFMCLPAYINTSIYKEKKIHLRVFRNFCWLIFLMGLVYSGCVILGKISWGTHSYNMAFSYYMLIPALGFTYFFYKYRNTVFLVASLMTAVCVIMLGSRGPLLCWIIFFLLALYFSDAGVFAKIIWAFALSGISIFYTQIINAIIPFFEIFGVNSRTLQYFTEGNIFVLGGRDTIGSGAFDLIKQNLFFGCGIGSDIANFGQYTHNLFLDILLHYGVVLGGILIVVLASLVISSFRQCEDRLMWFMFFCGGFIPCMMSGTYLSSVFLWLFIGYCRSNTSIEIKLV